jgi:hypothetical protein
MDELKKQWLSCPPDCYETYIEYLNKRKIPFEDTFENGLRVLIFNKKYRPHAWKLDFEKNSSNG